MSKEKENTLDDSAYLRVCKSCGEDFAKSVKECPHCGKKVQSGMVLMLIAGLGCLALAAALAIPLDKGQSDDIATISAAAVDPVDAAELAAAFGRQSAQNDHRAQQKVREITGKIVEWDLEVFVCTRSADCYQLVTKPTAAAPGTLLRVYPRNNQQSSYLDNIQPGQKIRVKGKISGMQQGRIKIDPAMIL